MPIRKLVRTAIESTLLGISKRLFGASSVEQSPHVSKTYDPKKHKSYYAVSLGIIQTLLKSDVPKTSRALAVETGFAESTIRQYSSMLADEGILRKEVEFPAAYTVGNREMALQFAGECEGLVGAFVPPSPIEEAN